MEIEIPLPDVDWKRRYVEAITTTTFPEYNGKRDHKGGGEIPGWALVKMVEKLNDKETKENDQTTFLRSSLLFVLPQRIYGFFHKSETRPLPGSEGVGTQETQQNNAGLVGQERREILRAG